MQKAKRHKLYCPACLNYITNQSTKLQKLMRKANAQCLYHQDTYSAKLCTYFRIVQKAQAQGGRR